MNETNKAVMKIIIDEAINTLVVKHDATVDEIYLRLTLYTKGISKQFLQLVATGIDTVDHDFGTDLAGAMIAAIGDVE